ncbi:MAG TPA: MarR family transcriptional regulator [Candidatus Limnocylindrales bacterium]
MNRDSTVDAVVRALRRVNFEGTLFGQSVAIRLGLSESDIAAIEWLVDLGPATAGRLAELMGLTTGAVTRMIDRLEQAGYVRRRPDPADRRRVIIEIVPEKMAAARATLDSVARASSEEIGRYTEAQLQLINEFLTNMANVTRTEVTRLRGSEDDEPEATPLEGEHTAPLGGLTSARLAFRGGTSDLQLRANAALGELYRARFEGVIPQVRLRDGVVSVQYRGRPWDWRKRKADVTLSGSIPWSVEIQGGNARCRASLTELMLSSFELVGGTAGLELELGRPTGVVPIRVIGGAKSVRLRRPAGVAVGLRVIGGVERIDFDDQRIGATREASLHSPGADGASDRYDVEIVGGVLRVAVATAD